MTVAELIDILSDLPASHQVILSRDAEGNSHSPLFQCWEGQYIPENTYSGEAVNAEDGEEFGYVADDAVILTPTY